jgi:multidrug efflux pump subunit AcrB
MPVDDVEYIESQSLFGVGVIRIYFYPNAKIEAAVPQVAANSRATLETLAGHRRSSSALPFAVVG